MDVVINGQKLKHANKIYSLGCCKRNNCEYNSKHNSKHKRANIKDTYCALGKYGYIFSMMEQLGYLFRYYLIETNNNKIALDENKLSHRKIKKYYKRFANAYRHYNFL
jgi:hypothetical protein